MRSLLSISSWSLRSLWPLRLFRRAAPSYGRAALTTALLLAGSAQAADPRQIDVAIANGRRFLYAQQKDGTWEQEFDKRGDQATGQTALVVEALLAAGESHQDERLVKAIEYIKKTPTTGVYALGVRCQLWLSLPQTADVRQVMSRDSKALVNGIQRDGAVKGFYPYNLGDRPYSLSRAHYAVLGVWAAAQTGIEAPTGYWQLVEKSWIEQQDPSGGWAYKGYHAKADDKARYPVTPGMTADGIMTLFITQDYLRADEAVIPRGNLKNPHIDKALAWLTSNFKLVAEDTKFNRAYPYATLYAIERVGAASGLKYFNNLDWYDIGADRLLRNQRSDGSWPGDAGGFNVSGTAFAMLFLTRGRAPVVMNKLEYDDSPGKPGNWNQRPRDVGNITRWIGKQTERDLNWQIVNLNAPVSDLHDAPILYISGNQELKFSKEHCDKLREYVESGGMILGNADATAPAFVTSFKKLAKELFPDYELRQLPPTHTIFTKQQFPIEKWKRKPGVLGLSNGARELMLLLPDVDISRAWQMQETGSKEELFQLAANVFLYSVDKKDARNKGESYQVAPDPRITAKQTITVARIKYPGAWNPEPGGWRRMAAIMNNRDRLGLDLQSVDPSSDSLANAKVAHLTGVGRFKLSDGARAALRKFVDSGRMLVIDSAGGNPEFAQSVETELGAIFGEAAGAQLKEPFAPDHPIYSAGGKKLPDAAYRVFARQSLVGDMKSHRLRGIEFDGRLAVVYSPEDLSVGLVGQPVDGIVGYEARTATALMRNILLMASGKSGGSGTSAPSSKPK